MSAKVKVIFSPVHPGELLEEAIAAAGVTQTQLAEHLGVTQSKISDICRGRRGLSLEMAAKLGRAFGQSTEFWYNLQKQFELDSFNEAKVKHIDRVAA